MIPGSYYLFIYLFIVSILTLKIIFKYWKTVNYVVIDSQKSALYLAIFLSLFIGLRPNDPIFADTVGYVASYKYQLGEPFHLSLEDENLIFDNLFKFFASYQLGWHSLFLLIASIYFIGIYKSCKNIFPNNSFVAFLVYLAAFSTFSYGTNGIKAGAAAAIFLCALAYRNERPILASILAFASWGFHHSMFPCIAGFFIVWYYCKPKWYFIFWGVCCVLSLTHVTYFQTLFMGYSDAKGASYLDTDNMAGWDGRTGFRYDFVLYSCMPILIGVCTVFKKKIADTNYNRLLCLYLFTNGLWLLCMYAGFTNRIAYLSWLLYPVVLIYPFLNVNWGFNKYKMLSKVVLVHLAFTLFMYIFYYT